MPPDPFQVVQESRRLDGMPRAQARAQLGDRIARSFQLTGVDFVEALAFNAHLTTELRKQAEAVRRPTLWEPV